MAKPLKFAAIRGTSEQAESNKRQLAEEVEAQTLEWIQKECLLAQVHDLSGLTAENASFPVTGDD